jgi:hypothetical protein
LSESPRLLLAEYFQTADLLEEPEDFGQIGELQ